MPWSGATQSHVQSVEAVQLSKGLDSRHGDDGTAIRLVSPVLFSALGEGEVTLEGRSRLNVILDDAELELDDLITGVAVDLAQRSAGIVSLAAEDEDTWRLGKPVHEAELDDGGHDTESDWALGTVRLGGGGEGKLTQDAPANARSHASLETGAEGGRDDLAEGDEERVRADTPSAHGCWCEFSDVKWTND